MVMRARVQSCVAVCGTFWEGLEQVVTLDPTPTPLHPNPPVQAYVTDRAVRAGRANASSGRIMVTAPADHFGPIGPEFDPERNLVRRVA